jgi:amino-acid N-acetyltransferase
MIESPTERDLPEIRALLERLQLPIAGVDEHLPTMLVAREDEQIVGTAGLHLATTSGANTVFLLTTTAERFFPQFGFEQIDREQVPPSVRASVEFRSACPASAIVMRKQL